MIALRVDMDSVITSMSTVKAVESELEKARDYFQCGDYVSSFNTYLGLAENGNSFSQCEVGFMYYQGQGTSRNLDAAEKWFRLSLQNGEIQASVGLIRVLLEHDRFQDALVCIKRYVRLKYPPAIYWMGRMYYNGYGVARDSRKALKYFTLASRYGHLIGMRDRAKLMLYGKVGFLCRFIGLLESMKAFFLIVVALKKDRNHESLYF